MDKKETKFLSHRKSRASSMSFKKTEILDECEKLFKICSYPPNVKNLTNIFIDMMSVLEKIKRLEGRIMRPTKRSNSIDNFMEWLKRSNAQVDGVNIHKFAGYDLGLQAKIDFKETDIILKIPETLFFNAYTAAPELDDIQNDMLIQRMPQITLALALIVELNRKHSNWKPYLDILPETYHTVLYMDIDDIMELKGSTAFESSLKQCINIARQYSYLYLLFQRSEKKVSKLLRNYFTYDAYRWAVSTVMTRQNIIPKGDGQEFIHSLIPMWDMCNHEEGKITTNFDKSSNCCECHAMKNFNSGDQIFIYYGPRTNTEFFIHSGFIYPGNKNDGLKICLGISKDDPLRQERIELLSRIHLPPVGEYLLKVGPELMSKSLLGFLKIFCMNKDELDFCLNSRLAKDSGKDEDNILALPIQGDIYKFLKTRLELLLRNYKSYAQMNNQLGDVKLQTCRKIVIEMKLLEMEMICKIVESLNNSEKYM